MNLPIFKTAISRGLVLAVVFSSVTFAASPQDTNATAPAPTEQTVTSVLPDAPPPARKRAPEQQRKLTPFAGCRLAPAHSADSTRAVTVLEDTVLKVQTVTPLSSGAVNDGADLVFVVSEDAFVGDVLAIPRGATARGVVVQSKKAGTLAGSPELMLKLVLLDLGGQTYPLYSHLFRVKGISKTRSTQREIVGGAAVGALAASIDSAQRGETNGSARLASMGKGTAVGAGVGTVVAAATPGPVIQIPSESEVEFSLAAPITITPVSAAEAARLAEGLNPGGPSLYVRGETP